MIRQWHLKHLLPYLYIKYVSDYIYCYKKTIFIDQTWKVNKNGFNYGLTDYYQS